MAEAETTTVGRYRLIRKLARGGMAEVYLARSQGARGFEKTVAIKRILPHFAQDEQFVRMMVDEAKISVLLNHPNIAQIFEFGEEESEFFLVMEYVGGQSLSKLVKRMRKRSERMDVLEAVFVVMQMLQGLHAAHTQKNTAGEPANIIHRDVSPQNVLLSWDGHIKVIDFGIARAKNRLERTEVGTIKGKLRYLAPEMIDPVRFSQRGDFDHRVDIFAAGIVLFELVAGRTLFSGANELEVYDMITGAPVPDLASEGIVDEDLMVILRRALEKQPQDRYRSAEEMADELRGYLYSRDPKFTAKRIAALMQTYFAAEREALMELEKQDASGSLSGQRELNLTRTSYTPSRVDRVKQTTADRKSSASRSRSQSKKTGPRIEGLEPGVRPDAETRVALDADFPNSASHPSFSQASGSLGGPPGTNPSGRGWSNEADTHTRLPMPGGGEDHEGFTPATDTQIVGNRPPPGPAPKKKKSPVVLVLAAAAGLSLILSVLIIIGITRPDPVDPTPVDPTNPTDPTNPEDPTNPTDPVANPAGMVPLLVAAEPGSAKVELVGSDEGERTVPAVFMAKAGTTVEVRVFAENYESRREKVVLPATGEAKVELALRPMPVALRVQSAPEGADITVDGEPYTEGMMVEPGKTLKIVGKKKGFRSATREVTAEAGKAMDVALSLKKIETPIRKPTGKGRLTITTTPYWGRVTIDGRTLEETTPVTVRLSAGTHEITVSHPPKGIVKRFKVNIEPGKRVRRTVQF